MSFQDKPRAGLDYRLCRYGASRLLFRGPKQDLTGDYVAFLGSTETFGKFIARPFPELVEDKLGIACVNFGCVNASVDAFYHDPEVLAAAGRAKLAVIQIMGAHNLSNRFYRVHPRRNDRFVTASTMMQSVFHDIDFTEYSFTRHLLNDINDKAADRFGFLRAEMRAAWSARMRGLLQMLPNKKLLLWFANHAPPKRLSAKGLGPDPLFIDRPLIEGLRSAVDGIVEVRTSQHAQDVGTEGMLFGPLEQPAAEHMLGRIAHQEAATVLGQEIQKFLNQKKARRSEPF